MLRFHWFNILEGDDDVLWMFYNHPIPPTKVGLAKSVDGFHFCIVNDSILETSSRFGRWGRWDSILIESHTVIRVKDKWRMYFGGYDGHWRIGYAESDDLQHWRKRGQLFTLGKAPWESVHVADPHVIDMNGTRFMYYMGKGDVWQVGLAIEDDHSLMRYVGNPIIEANKEWNRGCICLSGITRKDGLLLGTVHGYSYVDKRFRGYLMSSEDGFTWAEKSCLGEEIIHPELHFFDDKAILYYTSPAYKFKTKIILDL
jgi:hypothetical protein